MPELDPRTPVLIGVGQVIDRLGEVGFEALSPVQLAARACVRAVDDAQGDPGAVRAAIDTVAGIRQFEISLPGATAPLGRSNNYPRSVAQRIGTRPARAILEIGGGQGPQHLITEVAGEIAAGRSRVALVFGSEAISTARALADAPESPDFSETVEGDLEDRGFGLEGIVSPELWAHGLTDAPSLYALLENARRARLGLSRGEYDGEIGRLFAPFTRVAAHNPYAAAPVERTAEELITTSEANRPIADPYRRYVVSRDQVNQGAAVLISSVEAARSLGVPENRWVYIHGHADLRERDIMDRPDLSRSPAAQLAARAALEMAGVDADAIATWDFYSCFPIAVFTAAIDGLGLSPDDERGLTLTGGLPFFGGAGNDYSMHAVAETVQHARRRPGSFGFVGANGGIMSKYSTAVYSTAPREWQHDRSAQLQAVVDSPAAVLRVTNASGWATIETYTIRHDSAGRKTGIVIGRLDGTGARFVASAREGDAEALAVLESEQPVGRRVRATPAGSRNHVVAAPSGPELPRHTDSAADVH